MVEKGKNLRNINFITKSVITKKEIGQMKAWIINGELMHEGVKRRSGRYPWGSGENPYQHDSRTFASRVKKLKEQGWKETPENIAKEFGGISTTWYRMELKMANFQQKYDTWAKVNSMAEHGMTPTEIGKKLGKNESSIRAILNSKTVEKVKASKETIDFLRDQIETKGMIDVGKGVSESLNIPQSRLDFALSVLNKEGYPIYAGGISQLTNPNGNQTTQLVACKKGTKHAEIYDFDKVKTVQEYISHDNGNTFSTMQYPSSMDSKRLKIRYAEDGGIKKDGLVEIKPGVKDLSLGDAHYAQVRILVDGTHYIKGMAVYGNEKDFPKGTDVIFNTNKKKDKSKMEVLKPIEKNEYDPNNPFGATIKANGGQSFYIDKNGKKQLSLINKKSDEGDWSEWKDRVPAQFLSKQPTSLIKHQMDISVKDKQEYYKDIKNIKNPIIREKMMLDFANECDKNAVSLHAASFPGQKYHVMLPVSTLKDTECYCNSYENGTKLALVRYPHGSISEIPILTVNNKHKDARKIMGKLSHDAIGLNSKVAERLSGADFDGDTVMCVPTHRLNSKVKIKNKETFSELKDFDPKTEYPFREGMKVMTKSNTGRQMGEITNLISDMTILGADDHQLARAIKHSMVVIDAHKHKLDYKRSEEENGIKALKKEFQQGGGVGTLITRAKSQVWVDKTVGEAHINKKGDKYYDPSKPEGDLVYRKSDKYKRTYIDKVTGETIVRTRKQKSSKMAEAKDANELLSVVRTKTEKVYADYANALKDMARKARLDSLEVKQEPPSTYLKNKYKTEIESLQNKMTQSNLNQPKEREALRRANAKFNKITSTGGELESGTPKDKGKAAQRLLNKSRAEVSAHRYDINITPKEWEAINNNAIPKTLLSKIIKKVDSKNIWDLVRPKDSIGLSSGMKARIKMYAQNEYTLNEIAKALNISKSTVEKYLKEGDK